MLSITLLQVNRCAIGLAMIVLVGCQTYEPMPLDLSAHEAAWRERVPAGEEVRAFMDRLAQTPGRSVPDFDPQDGLSHGEAEIVALVFNPDLRLARLRVGVARAVADHAGLWDDPEISIDVLKVTRSVPDPWVVGSVVSFTLPISGRLEAEKARAEAALHVELDRVAEAEWQTQHDLGQAWLLWSALQLKWEQTQQLVQAMDRTVASYARLVEAGERDKTEAALFVIEQVRRRAEAYRLQAEVAEQEQQIRALLGLSPEAPVRLIPSMTHGDEVSSPEAPAQTNLTMIRLRREYDVAEQTLLREVRKQYPDLAIGPQYEDEQGQSRIGFVGAIPLPILNANKGGIAGAREQREIARAAYETEYEKLVGRLAIQRVRQKAARDQASLLSGTLAPMVDRQMADAQQLVALGEGESLLLLESLVRAHETKLQWIDARLQGAQAGQALRFLKGPAWAHVEEVDPVDREVMP